MAKTCHWCKSSKFGLIRPHIGFKVFCTSKCKDRYLEWIEAQLKLRKWGAWLTTKPP